MKKYLIRLGLVLALSGAVVASAALGGAALASPNDHHDHDHDERVTHYHAEKPTSTADAHALFHKKMRRIEQQLATRPLDRTALEAIHEASYGLEAAVDYLLAHQPRHKKMLAKIDAAVQRVHHSSEDHKETALRAAFKQLQTASVSIAQIGRAGRANNGEVNLYSAQKEHLIRPILNVFEKQSGIKVNMITGGKAALVARLEHEGKNTPADILLTVDIGNIYQAQKRGLLQTVRSEILQKQIPAYLRDPQGQWYGLTIRTRAIFYNKNAAATAPIKTYEELADKKWRGKLLIRSSSNVYNQSLVAAMLAHHGEAETKKWLKGVVANFARPPQGGDSDQLRALGAGEGALAVANSYYFGRLIAGGADIENPLVQKNVGIIFPNQAERGAHINIRGGGVTKHAKNKKNAIKLLEFLASDEAQAFFAKNNFEYPAKQSVATPQVLQNWGAFKRDTINLEAVGKLQSRAIKLMDEVGWP